MKAALITELQCEKFATLLCKHKQSRELLLKTVSPAPTLGLQYMYELNTDVCRKMF